MNKLKRNLSLQTIYQIVVTITPLITSPYLSRKLGVESLGIYSYTYSIINYFMLFCMLGIINYGTRTIASLKKEDDEKSILSEIYALQLFFCFISSIVFIIFIILNNNIYLIMQSFWILSCFFDVTWYFFGKENFKITVLRNLIIKILTIVFIFLLIKTPNDLWKYILIMSVGTLLSQFILWIGVINKINFRKLKIKNIFKHFKPIFILFIPILAMSVFHIMDKTMLGALSTSTESGYYYNSDKIVNIPLGILTGIGTVMLSNITSLISNNRKEEAIGILKKSLKYITCISIAFCFGIAAISKDFVPIFFGNEYNKCIDLINLFSIVIIIKSISDILRTQYMIPFKKEKYFIIAVIVGSIVNILMNFIFIRFLNMGALGATIGTIIAEMTVCIIEIIFVNRYEKIYKNVYKNIWFILFGIIMYIMIYIIALINVNVIVKLALEIIIGGSFYMLMCGIYFIVTKDEIIYKIKNRKKELQ